MTATLRRLNVDRSPTSLRVFRVVVAVTAMVAAVAALAPSNDTVSMAVVVVVIALFGIPHGAVDHLVAAAIEPTGLERPERRWVTSAQQWRFHVAYVSAMLAYGLVWLATPAVGLAAFLGLSVHHFGQSDLAHLRLERPYQIVIQLSRGLFLVGLLLVANLEAVAPVIERMGGFDSASWPWLANHTAAWSIALVGQHLAVGLVSVRRLRGDATITREVVTVVTLTALFIAADPLIGFAVYFGLWHSLNHLNVLGEVLRDHEAPTALAPVELARLVAPRSAVSIVALGMLVVGAQTLGRTEWIVPLALVFVSMLTLPHMVVVERLWRAHR
ncbi:MAG: Brp/Blh family beta-carotene 15,15'-monooxygenase [Ilumatobacter sp.]|jgi:Brp/Blh family beta-carotene 15,15'-monooxygenase